MYFSCSQKRLKCPKIQKEFSCELQQGREETFLFLSPISEIKTLKFTATEAKHYNSGVCAAACWLARRERSLCDISP